MAHNTEKKQGIAVAEEVKTHDQVSKAFAIVLEVKTFNICDARGTCTIME